MKTVGGRAAERECKQWVTEHPQATPEDAYMAGGHEGYNKGYEDGRTGEGEWYADQANPYPA